MSAGGALGFPDAGIRAGVIGDPVAHSLSPTIHRAAYRALGLDWDYGAFRVGEQDVAAALDQAAAAGFVGLSVTTPLKAQAARACDDRSEMVERIGVANTVVFHGAGRRAENTDGSGLLDDLSAACGFTAADEVCAVIGAGGAARAIVASLADAGASEVIVVNRSASHAVSAAALAGGRGRVGEVAALAVAALVVQATTISLSSDAAAASQFAAGLGPGQLVVDLAYNPAETEFLRAAAARGAVVRNGLGMLVHQAARQVALFTGQEAPLGVMWEAVAAS